MLQIYIILWITGLKKISSSVRRISFFWLQTFSDFVSSTVWTRHINKCCAKHTKWLSAYMLQNMSFVIISRIKSNRKKLSKKQISAVICVHRLVAMATGKAGRAVNIKKSPLEKPPQWASAVLVAPMARAGPTRTARGVSSCVGVNFSVI